MPLQNTPIRIGFIFEGTTDRETIPILVAKIINHPVIPVNLTKETDGFDDFKRRKRNGRQEVQASWGTLRSYVSSLIIEEVDAVVIVVDNDCEPLHKRWCQITSNLPFYEPISVIDSCERAATANQVNMHVQINSILDHVVRHVEQGFIPVVVGVAVQMLEAWLVAQPEIVQTVLWEPFTQGEVDRCVHPELIEHPKKELIVNNNGGSDLSQKQARDIGQNHGFLPFEIERRCPSFGFFVLDIHTMNQ